MNKNIKWIVLSLIILFLLPLLTGLFAGQNGMAICFIMFFAVNPIFFIFEGIVAGKNIKKHWYMPLISAIVYLLSMWLVFDMGETAFVIYSCIYLVTGWVVMLITSLIYKKRS